MNSSKGILTQTEGVDEWLACGSCIHHVLDNVGLTPPWLSDFSKSSSLRLPPCCSENHPSTRILDELSWWIKNYFQKHCFHTHVLPSQHEGDGDYHCSQQDYFWTQTDTHSLAGVERTHTDLNNIVFICTHTPLPEQWKLTIFPITLMI